MRKEKVYNKSFYIICIFLLKARKKKQEELERLKQEEILKKQQVCVKYLNMPLPQVEI